MIDSKVRAAIQASLQAFSNYGSFDAVPLADKFIAVFSTDKSFMDKVDDLDALFNDEPGAEALREVYFDLLMINFFSADAVKLEEDYLDSKEWEDIEEDTLDRGTEMLNLLLYLNECADEDIAPELEDYLKEFLLVDDDEFQDEYYIYEPVIENQILIESPLSEIARMAQKLPTDAELKELFYPMMAFFQNTDASEETVKAVADNAVEKDFDMAVFAILTNFK